MAKVVGGENEYLRKKETRNFDIGFSLPLLVITSGVFYLGYYIGARPRYTFLQLIIISLLVVFLTLLFLKTADLAFNKSGRYRVGRKGENSVYFTLKNLPTNFAVFQNVVIPERTGNIDFIVFGPTGLFTVEVKNYSGRITFENGVLLHDGKPFEKDIIQQATRQWQTLKKYLLTSAGVDAYIRPIIVFSGSHAKMVFGQKPIANNITIVKQEWLNEVITKNPIARQFSDEERSRIHEELAKLVATIEKQK